MDVSMPRPATVAALLVGMLIGGLIVYGGVVTGIFPVTQQSTTSPGSNPGSLQELEGATLWIDGTVERVRNSTIYIDESQDSDVVIPVSMGENPGLFRCQSNNSNLSCQPVELRGVQQEAEVCANVAIETGTVQAIKVFTNADCGGATSTQQ